MLKNISNISSCVEKKMLERLEQQVYKGHVYGWLIDKETNYIHKIFKSETIM